MTLKVAVAGPTEAGLNTTLMVQFAPTATDEPQLLLCEKGCGPLLESVMQRDRLSARSFDRIVRVARTIADLAGADRPAREHVAEALIYRRT